MEKLAELYQGREASFLMVSHYYEELDQLADKLLISLEIFVPRTASIIYLTGIESVYSLNCIWTAICSGFSPVFIIP